jgi:hypothetical protein
LTPHWTALMAGKGPTDGNSQGLLLPVRVFSLLIYFIFF